MTYKSSFPVFIPYHVIITVATAVAIVNIAIVKVKYTKHIVITRWHSSARVLWGRRWKSMGYGEIWPPATQKPLNWWSPKFVQMTTSGISTTKPNFIHRFKGFGSAHARYRDPRHKVTRLLLWVLEKGYRRDARTDFTQNTSNDVVPHKEVPFEGRETNI